MADLEKLLSKIAAEQEQQTQILKEQHEAELREQYLAPYRERLEEANAQAMKSGSNGAISMATKAKLELRQAQQDIELGKHRLAEAASIEEQLGILQQALESAQLDLHDAHTDHEKRPASTEALLRVDRERKKVARCQMDIKSFKRKNGLS